MDNRSINLTSIGVDDLRSALLLLHPPGGIVVGYAIINRRYVADEFRDNAPRMILYWARAESAHKEFIAFPFRMPLSKAAEFAHMWLEHEAEYGSEPDMDGDAKKGWRLYNNEWGRIDDCSTAFAAIEPVWALYGK